MNLISANIINQNECCGCYACINICPTKCILMKKNEFGSIQPMINAENCTNCNLCKRVCPELHPVNLYTPIKTYAAYSSDEIIRNMSSSGGVATEIARAIIIDGGVVYGTSMEKLEAKYIRVSKISDLNKLSGSKYLHSHIENTFSELKNDVLSNIKVAFIGTPCQIAGARNYMGKDYENLFMIDILCHGVPTLDCFRCGMRLETNIEVNNARFRVNNDYILQLYYHERLIVKRPYRASYFFNGFVEGYFFRENCYNCTYAQEKRCGDITLGDFWGIGEETEYCGNISKGVNVVLTNTNKGVNLINNIRTHLVIEERTIQEAAKSNHPLSKPPMIPLKYKKFKRLYKKYGGRFAILFAYPNKTLYIWLRKLVSRSRVIYNMVCKVPKLESKFKL